MLPLTGATGQTTLKVSCSYYYCQEGAEGLCKAAAVAWTVPIEIAPMGPAPSNLPTPLRRWNESSPRGSGRLGF